MHGAESTYSPDLNFTQVQTANIFSWQFQAHTLKRNLAIFSICLFISAVHNGFGEAGVSDKVYVLGWIAWAEPVVFI